MMTLTILNRKAPYCPALPAGNILYGIQVDNCIAVVGIAKPSVIVGIDEQAMLVRRPLKQKTRNKKRPRYHARWDDLIAIMSISKINNSNSQTYKSIQLI